MTLPHEIPENPYPSLDEQMSYLDELKLTKKFPVTRRSTDTMLTAIIETIWRYSELRS